MARRFRPRFARPLAVVVVLAAAVAAACTPSPTSGVPSESCAPPNTVLSRILVQAVSAPPGATLRAENDWHIFPGGGPIEDAGTAEQTLGMSTGSTVELSVGVPDPGRCIRLYPSAGLTYQVTQIVDPAGSLLWALGIDANPNVIRGSVPGTI